VTARKNGKGYLANTKNPRTGKRQRLVHDTAEEKNLAEAKFTVRQADLKKGPGEGTFEKAGAKYVTRLISEKKLEKARRVERYLRLHLNPIVGDRQLKFIDLEIVIECAAKLWDKPLSVATTKILLQVFCQVLRYGFGAAEPPVRFPREIPGGPKRAPYGSSSLFQKQDPIPFGRELSDRLETATGPLLMVLILVIKFGLRIGEALGLRHWDIHEDEEGKHWIQVRHTLKGNNIRKAPKTAAGERDIPISATQASYFQGWMAQVNADPTDQLISDEPGKIYSYGAMVYRHNKLQMTLYGPQYGFHAYRASCATLWLIANVSIANLIAWLGHADLRTTLESYANAIMFAEEIWKKLDQSVLELMVDESGELPKSPVERAAAEMLQEAA